MSEVTLAADAFECAHDFHEVENSGPIAVVPKVKVHGTTFTIDLKIGFAGYEDRKTFTLNHKNGWSQKRTFFSWPFATDLHIEVQRSHSRLHIRVSPPVVKPTDKYIPFKMLHLPGRFDKWQPHSGPDLDELRTAGQAAKPIGSSHTLELSRDAGGNAERCAFLGDADYPGKASEALGQAADRLGVGGNDVLMAIGVLGQGSAYVGGSLGGGMWWTLKEAGLYGGVGAQMGAIVGGDIEAVITVVVAKNGKNAIENFSLYHIARGVIGEGEMVSIALLGDTKDLEIYGVMLGGGLGGGASPAGGYVGASRQYLLEF